MSENKIEIKNLSFMNPELQSDFEAGAFILPFGSTAHWILSGDKIDPETGDFMNELNLIDGEELEDTKEYTYDSKYQWEHDREILDDEFNEWEANNI